MKNPYRERTLIAERALRVIRAETEKALNEAQEIANTQFGEDDE